MGYAAAGTRSHGKAGSVVAQSRRHAFVALARRRLRTRTTQMTLLVVALLLGWIVYLFVGISTNHSIQGARSVPRLAAMVQQNLDAADGKSLQTHFPSNTVSLDYGPDFVDKLDDEELEHVRVRPGEGFVEVRASGPEHAICAAWDVERADDGSYLLDPTPSIDRSACH